MRHENGKIVEKERDLEDTEGFITDFEFASLPHKETKTEIIFRSVDDDATPGSTGEEGEGRNVGTSRARRAEYIDVPNPKSAGDGMTVSASCFYLLTRAKPNASYVAGYSDIHGQQSVGQYREEKANFADGVSRCGIFRMGVHLRGVQARCA